MIDSATMSQNHRNRADHTDSTLIEPTSLPSMRLPKEGHRMRRRLYASVHMTSGEG